MFWGRISCNMYLEKFLFEDPVYWQKGVLAFVASEYVYLLDMFSKLLVCEWINIFLLSVSWRRICAGLRSCQHCSILNYTSITSYTIGRGVLSLIAMLLCLDAPSLTVHLRQRRHFILWKSLVGVRVWLLSSLIYESIWQNAVGFFWGRFFLSLVFIRIFCGNGDGLYWRCFLFSIGEWDSQLLGLDPQ